MALRWTSAKSLFVLGGAILVQSGCEPAKPNAGGTTSVNPAAAAKPGTPETKPAATEEKKPAAGAAAPAETPAPAEKEAPPAAPGGAGSTTGGGTETPAAGQ